MIQEYTVEVDGKHILFVDDIDDQLDVSSFEIMMDFIPVFYAYKYHSVGEYKTNLVSVSNICSVLSSFYTTLKKEIPIVRELTKEKNIKAYEKWLQNCWKQITELNENIYDFKILEPMLQKFERTLQDFRPLFNTFLWNYITNNYGMFFEKMQLKSTNISVAYMKRRFLYWMVYKEELFFLEERGVEVYRRFANANQIYYKMNSGNLLNFVFSLTLNNNVVENNVFSLCKKLAYTAKHIPDIKYATELDDFFNDSKKCISCKDVGKFKKVKKGTGCFAIMTDASNNLYYALSGEKNNEHNFDKLCQAIEQNVFVGQNSVRCMVSDNMVCYELVPMMDGSVFAYRPLLFCEKNGIDDGMYGCCERKILANPSVHEKNTFFIRWAPCSKCRPALLNRYEKIYAFEESSKNSANYDSTQMNEYTIELNGNFICKSV